MTTFHIVRPEYGGTFSTSPEHAPVRFTLPGELVDIDSGTSELTLLELSPNRTEPSCLHFGLCGGCDYQHAQPATQLSLKRTILHDLLTAASLTDLPAIQSHSDSEGPYEYRNRIRLRVEQVEGTFRAGYNRRGSKSFLPICECPIAAPILWQAAQCLLALTGKAAQQWLPCIAEVEFHTNGEAVQMLLYTRDRSGEAFAHTFTDLCLALAAQIPQLTGAGTLALTAGFGAKERASWGASGLTQTILDRPYWVTRGAFFQVNRFLLPHLVQLVTAGRTGALAWDLYAGVGLFSRVLATTFGHVVAVESAQPAASDLARTPKRAPAIQAIQLETAAFLQQAVLQRERPDLVVMDPPRAGLGRDVCTLLSRVAAPHLVYVSCDPTTLARDLRQLVDSGYRIAELHLLDMFPQTFHLETVVLLER